MDFDTDTGLILMLLYVMSFLLGLIVVRYEQQDSK